jgi:hypothetical protein
MAQPNAEPVEDYDYESLPPNFSLLQNMAAGAFAGIAEHCASTSSQGGFLLSGSHRCASLLASSIADLA